MVWEMRPTNGLDTSGGCFKAGATGTDYSQQNTPQYSLTGLTTAAANAIILTASASADMVGNGINITSGTNFTVGIYEIISVSVGVSITVDRNCSTAAGAAGVAQVGGAIQTLAKLAANQVGSNKAFVKAEATITVTGGTTFGAGAVVPSETVPFTALLGYTTTRGDFGQVSITASTNTGIIVLRFTNTGWLVDGFNVNCSSLGTSRGIRFDANFNECRNCKVANFATAGIDASNSVTNSIIHHCEVTGGTGGTGGIVLAGAGWEIHDCWIHDNACSGITGSTSTTVITRCVISNNTGASSDGINTSGWLNATNNAIYKNGRHGIFLSGSPTLQPQLIYIRNNIITDHTAGSAAGIKLNTAALPASPKYDGNFYFNNTSNRVNLDDTTTNAVDAVAPYTNVFDVQLTASPFTSAAGNDFTLNNTAGGGALVRAKGLPGVGGTVYSGIPGLTTLNGFLDGGVYQHADPVLL